MFLGITLLAGRLYAWSCLANKVSAFKESSNGLLDKAPTARDMDVPLLFYAVSIIYA